VCALHCAQSLHIILLRTDLITFSPTYPPENHCSDDVYLREGGTYPRSSIPEPVKEENWEGTKPTQVQLENRGGGYLSDKLEDSLSISAHRIPNDLNLHKNIRPNVYHLASTMTDQHGLTILCINWWWQQCHTRTNNSVPLKLWTYGETMIIITLLLLHLA